MERRWRRIYAKEKDILWVEIEMHNVFVIGMPG